MRTNHDDTLRTVVGAAAIVAPVLHCTTDAMEWLQGGFSRWQLWLNYCAFLPMPWLLLGVYAVRARQLATTALVGALLYGAAFTYFASTTLFALQMQVSDYEVLWQQLSSLYTVHGAVMVAGGLLFSWAAWQGRAVPRPAVALFAAGLLVNLGLAVVPAPDLLQTAGTAIRNAGIVWMGCALLSDGPSREG
ncbi:putative membrane protein [uncultured Defluviicoccus sp.]|uniref:Putative membrane protein n=1 Tax=metagenome TaxID=256318 RepID=A0A380TD02_9ZZZZ|nr:putative membrane protein [uncultured Defluviicoccus sp.]